MTMRKKLLITIACLSVILCTMIVGTIAWLTDKTGSVMNTFTPSNISISLTETEGGADKAFKMVPGVQIKKDPVVTVAANSEACYLFVQINENLGAWAGNGAEFSDYLTYSVITGSDGWASLDGVPGVYYREVDAGTASAGKQFYILTGNTITVNETVTKADMDKLYVTGAQMPTLTFTAYACQKEGFIDAAAAWAEASK